MYLTQLAFHFHMVNHTCTQPHHQGGVFPIFYYSFFTEFTFQVSAVCLTHEDMPELEDLVTIPEIVISESFLVSMTPPKVFDQP